jgi:hypothetical protein
VTDNDNPWPLLIPIGVLVIVFLGTGVIWMMIPIAVLVCVFFGAYNEDRKIGRQRREMRPINETRSGGYVDGPSQDSGWTTSKPIYERRTQKDQGVSLGILIPIFILSWIWVTGGFSWPILIPIFVLSLAFLGSVFERTRGRAHVKEQLTRRDIRTVHDIADRAGIPEEQARRHIVHEKRRGESEVWFDPSTGEISSTPVTASGESSVGCPYCGFALKSEDRYCPYCGAPIRA